MSLNHRLTSKIQSGIDIRLNEIDRFAAQLALDDTNLSLSKSLGLVESDTPLLIDLSARLGDYKLSNSLISQIFIYYPKLDYVVGDLGYFNSRKYYLLSNELSDKGYSSWIKNLTADEGGGYYFVQDENQETHLYLVKYLPYNNSSAKDAVLVLRINREEIQNMLRSEGTASKDFLNVMITSDGAVYTCNGNTEKLNLLDKILNARAENPYVVWHGYFASIQHSDFYDFSYVTLTDKRQILNISYFTQNIAYCALALCMVTGCMLFAFWGIRNNKPICKILEKLPASSPGESKVLFDDYRLIDRGIDAMLENAQTNQKNLDQQKNNMERLFLYNLLASEERSNALIFSAMQRFGLQLEYPLFQIMLLRDMQGFATSQEGTLIREISDHLRAKWQDLYVIAAEYRGDLVFLLHMEADYDDAQMELVAADLLLAGGHGPDSRFLFAGNIYDTMSDIVTSYHQACMLAELPRQEDSHILFYHAQTPEPLQTEAKDIGAMAEYEISMLEKNYVKARTQVDFLFNQYIGMDRNVFTARAKKYAVINSLIEALSQIPDSEKSEKDYITRLRDAKDNHSLLSAAHEVFQFLIEYQKKKQTIRKENVALQAQEYILANFSDPMIGLYSLSDMLGISNTYLSTVFKKNYGAGIAQYINRLRIEKAKKLITSTDHSIKEIALDVGFSSDVTFIRVFKQFENMTPGKFKKEGVT